MEKQRPHGNHTASPDQTLFRIVTGPIAVYLFFLQNAETVRARYYTQRAVLLSGVIQVQPQRNDLLERASRSMPIDHTFLC